MDTLTFLVEDETTGYLTSITYDPYGAPVSRLVGVHSSAACKDHYCAIHNRPSIHPLSMEPLVWNDEYACLERLCSHGYVHPDKDNVDYFEKIGGFPHEHNTCDGCCTEEGYKG